MQECVGTLARAGWRLRLAAAVKRDGRSATEISIAAGLSHGYLHSILRDIKPQDPTIGKLVRIVGVLPGVSLHYIMEGYELSPEAEQLLRIWAQFPPDRRQSFLDFLAGQSPKKEE